MPTSPPLCFVDCETTGLDAFRHQVYEVGLITPSLDVFDPDEVEADETQTELTWDEHHWWLSVDLTVADPVALRIGGYHDRHPLGFEGSKKPTADQEKLVTDPKAFASKFARLTNGLHLAGMVPSFDELFLRGILMTSDQCPMWNYHLIDVEVLAVGYLAGSWKKDKSAHPHMPGLPWDSEVISEAVGVDPAKFERHTALGDARWAKAIYEVVQGG